MVTNQSFFVTYKSSFAYRFILLAGGIAGGCFGAILPHAHLVRKPLQSMHVNRDIQDLIHLITQLVFPIILSMTISVVVGKIGSAASTIYARPEEIGVDKVSPRKLVPYLLFDIALFSFDLLSTHRWKDIKNIVLKNTKPE
ncbi:unknown protein [Simkania negevensis Z]|uniref:Uncharacterized protein n=2 Tax=Simkania negevensis TaxID=83561 RepID=F8L3S6_SIMNZ|nr:unknown protein [Simkania negevensis Z]